MRIFISAHDNAENCVMSEWHWILLWMNTFDREREPSKEEENILWREWGNKAIITREFLHSHDSSREVWRSEWGKGKRAQQLKKLLSRWHITWTVAWACEENLFTLISLRMTKFLCLKKRKRIEWHKSMMSHENFPFLLLFVHSNFHTCHFFHKVLTMKIHSRREEGRDGEMSLWWGKNKH